MNKRNRLLLISLLSSTILVGSVAFPVACSKVTENKPIDKPNKPPIDNSVPSLDGAKHSLSFSNIKNLKSPLEIIKQTPKFKIDVQNVIDLLEAKKDNGLAGTGKADFTRYGNESPAIDEFFKAIKDIGVYGDFGSSIEDKMFFTPKVEIPKYFMEQLYVDKFSDNENINAITSQINIDNIIKWNPFGFLPSNLSQLFYYLDLSSISNIFNIQNTKEIKINFDDEIGTLDILLINSDNNKYIFKYNSQDNNTTTALKRNKDFRQFIYDRTILILNPSMAQFEAITFPKKTIPLKELPNSGTGFILDRVLNPNLGPNQYEFLVATNMHVLDFSKSYNKDRTSATGINNFSTEYEPMFKPGGFENLYNSKFDGGVIYKGGINGDGRDIIQNVTEKWEYGKFTTRNNDPNIKIPLRLQKPNKQDVDDVIQQENIALNTSETNINRTNLIDAVWYTPEFNTSGVWTNKEILHPIFDIDINSLKDKRDIKQNYQEWEGKYTGTISNAGADFVITKIVLTKDEIKKVLPSLFNVLDTNKEKDWYIGIGNNSEEVEISANSTLFSGGFPERVYDTKKWNSGRILAQKRYIPNEKNDPFSIQQYWTRYDEQLNKKYNDYRGLTNWYKHADMNFLSMNQQENALFNPKGMQVQKVLQFPLFVASDNGSINDQDTLHGGASGSMVINSRFELVGSLFGYKVWDDNNRNQSNNFFQIFKQYTEANKSYSMIKQIKDKLNKEGLKTLKINP